MSPRTLLRDSAILLILSTAAAFVLKGAGWALPFALSGVVAIANLYLLSLLTRNLVDLSAKGEGGNGMRLALGMIVKLTITVAALVVLIATFDVGPVLFGFGVVLIAITARGVLGLFLPAPAQEA